MATKANIDLTQLTYTPGATYDIEIPSGLVVEVGGSENDNKSQTLSWSVPSIKPNLGVTTTENTVFTRGLNLSDLNGNQIWFLLIKPNNSVYPKIKTGNVRLHKQLTSTTSQVVLTAPIDDPNYFVTGMWEPNGSSQVPALQFKLGTGTLFEHNQNYFLTADQGVISNLYSTAYSDAVTTSTANLYSFKYLAVSGISGIDRNFIINDQTYIFNTNYSNGNNVGVSLQNRPLYEAQPSLIYTITLSSSFGEFGFNIDGSDKSSNFTWSGTYGQLNNLVEGSSIYFSKIIFWPTKNITSGTFTYTQVRSGVTEVVETVNLTGITVASTSTILPTILSNQTWKVPYATIKYPEQNWKFDILMVAAGGGGSYESGGGAGGFLQLLDQTLTTTTYSIVIGSPGLGRSPARGTLPATSGTNTIAFGRTVYGGNAGQPSGNGYSGAPTIHISPPTGSGTGPSGGGGAGGHGNAGNVIDGGIGGAGVTGFDNFVYGVGGNTQYAPTRRDNTYYGGGGSGGVTNTIAGDNGVQGAVVIRYKR